MGYGVYQEEALKPAAAYLVLDLDFEAFGFRVVWFQVRVQGSVVDSLMGSGFCGLESDEFRGLWFGVWRI